MARPRAHKGLIVGLSLREQERIARRDEPSNSVTDPLATLRSRSLRSVSQRRLAIVRDAAINAIAPTLPVNERRGMKAFAYVAKALLWAEETGRSTDLADVLTDENVAAFVTARGPASRSSKTTIQGDLRWVRAFHTSNRPTGVKARRAITPPHTPAERTQHYSPHLNSADPFDRQCVALLDLAYEAGAKSAEAVRVRGTDVHTRDGFTYVRVPGRVVPVPLRRQPGLRLLAAAEKSADDHLLRPGHTRGHVIEDVKQFMSLPGFDVERARRRWLVDWIDRDCPLRYVAAIAGLKPGGHLLQDLLKFSKALTEEELAIHTQHILEAQP